MNHAVERLLLTKLTIRDVGKEVGGWYFEDAPETPAAKQVIVQCPKCFTKTPLRPYSISTSGEIEPAFVCRKKDFKQITALADWPSHYEKQAKKHEIIHILYPLD